MPPLIGSDIVVTTLLRRRGVCDRPQDIFLAGVKVERNVLVLRSCLGQHGMRLSDLGGMRTVDVVLGIDGVDVRRSAMGLHVHVSGHLLA